LNSNHWTLYYEQKSGLATFYYALALVGFLATWYYNGQYILNGGGLGPKEFFGAAFANLLTTAIAIDVYLAALVFSVWVISDAKRAALKWPWLYVVLAFGIGLAIAFPLYLASREKALGDSPVK
jgi:Terpene cyclase DEP1